MAVVKADAYGHGAVRVARTALKAGATFLAVARFEEALGLRNADIDAPILLFGYSLPEYVPYMAENGVRAAVNTLDSARQLSRQAADIGTPLKVHIKIDTGMGRLGFPLGDLRKAPSGEDPLSQTVEIVKAVAALPGIHVEGIFTHFANADSKDKSHARGQFARFLGLLDALQETGIQFPLRHAANSAAIIELPETHLDLVRAGIAQYGLWPSEEVDRSRIHLQPAMTLKSRIIQVKSVPAGFAVSYGSTYRTPRPTRIATVPIGYADGLDRVLSSRGQMLVNGVRAPILGRVCMDLTMIDVGHIPQAAPGEEVVVLGRQGAEAITAEEIAGLAGTINYEIVSSLTSRVVKVFID